MEGRGVRRLLAGLRGHEIIEIGAPEWERLRTYVQVDLAGVAVAALWLGVLWAGGRREGWLLGIVALLLVRDERLTARHRRQRPHRPGEPQRRTDDR
ncbi:hypothetical protein ACWEPC_56225, partial [Nonomuraea sp. NPDC004297]